MDNHKEAAQSFEKLLHIMDDLRAKCPWDMKQTNESLLHLTIEEVYELSDEILKGSAEGIKEELGDIFLHLVFYAKLGSEQSQFDAKTVLDSLNQKLIDRHPHVYGEVEVKDEEEVKRNWEQLKLKEGRSSVLGGVPSSLPALIKAYRIQEKVAKVGFEWKYTEEVKNKVDEEWLELQEAVQSGDSSHIEEEFGDMLFSLINYARFIQVDPEAALARSNMKFMKRFSYIEESAKKNQMNLQDMSLDEMEALWQKAKETEH